MIREHRITKTDLKEARSRHIITMNKRGLVLNENKDGKRETSNLHPRRRTRTEDPIGDID